jgi:hypothetical protein
MDVRIYTHRAYTQSTHRAESTHPEQTHLYLPSLLASLLPSLVCMSSDEKGRSSSWAMWCSAPSRPPTVTSSHSGDRYTFMRYHYPTVHHMTRYMTVISHLPPVLPRLISPGLCGLTPLSLFTSLSVCLCPLVSWCSRRMTRKWCVREWRPSSRTCTPTSQTYHSR